MAIPKVKVTYSLDELTAKKLGEIARRWNTSKSGALSRLINETPDLTPAEEIARKLRLVEEFQASMRHLTPEQVEQWIRDSDEIRHSWVSPWEDVTGDGE